VRGDNASINETEKPAKGSGQFAGCLIDRQSETFLLPYHLADLPST
jgi:hypothetical protein